MSGFDVKPNVVTPHGIRLDLRDAPSTDIVKLDERVGKMIVCLEEELRKVNYHPPKDWQCQSPLVEPGKFKWDCYPIKVVPAAKSPCSPDQEFLPVLADPRLCVAKGLEPKPECPCRWRTLVQHGFSVITPPRLYLWELGRQITGCHNLWSTPAARCLVF